MLKLGLNPYGLTWHLGLQGRGTPRTNPNGTGLEGLIAIAEEIEAEAIEIFDPWLAAMSDDELARLSDRLKSLGMTPIVSAGLDMMGPIESALRSAKALDAKVIRLGLSPVLEGSRNAWGGKWGALNASIRAGLGKYAPMAADQGRVLAIENHQDFTSRELVAFCEEFGPGLGITFDMGNTFPVLEAPLDFTRIVAPYVKHAHLKDYRVQATDEGYRLVRCAIGDGAVPFVEMMRILLAHNPDLTAVLEPGALEARHIRFHSPDWWQGYAPKSAPELAACLAAACRNRLGPDEDYRTPWERGDDAALETYELDMIRRSAANIRALGLDRLETAQ
ncbi:sugar phosphate isomerase/epimerase [Arsenicitalea aurantiaca]|uniref:Sugar phosphate isomerase/epimerase n=1 Tax=Arsenicitalea aurantiaca TaxID=1783274 RepID=A0A433XAN6_9HYPH|nr:TIM barrel protein [Arsenicitalea aurantiaca]RUT31068.1 sugar phosphate isomerase/epimerase [Arsenicitalea aurantiaca]